MYVNLLRISKGFKGHYLFSLTLFNMGGPYGPPSHFTSIFSKSVNSWKLAVYDFKFLCIRHNISKIEQKICTESGFTGHLSQRVGFRNDISGKCA